MPAQRFPTLLDRILIGVCLFLLAAIGGLLLLPPRPPPVATTPGLPTARVVPRVAGQVVAPAGRLRLPSAPASTPALVALPAVAAGAPAGATATITPVALGGAPVAVPVAAPALPAGELQATPPPILMYHYIRSVDAASDPTGFALSVAPEVFAQQIAWLADNGYRGVRLDSVQGCLQGLAGCPARTVAITFDDGYFDAYSAALPILKQYGFSATFYIVNSFVGQPGYMGWGELTALRDAGMEIAAHTLDHLDLTSLDAIEAWRQIEQSKADLEGQLGIRITSFCYPAGRYSQALAEQVASAGYQNATTTRWDGDYSNLFLLPRVRVSGSMSLDGFAGAVGG